MRIGRVCVRVVCALAIMLAGAGAVYGLGLNDTAWVRVYNGPGGSIDKAIGVEVDAGGNVYVGGFGVGSGTGFDYVVLKYDSSGVLQWEQRYNGPGNGKDTATAFWLDASANVYIAGGSASSTTGLDFATLKYDAAGNVLWERRYNGPANLNDLAAGLFVDATGNVYVSGDSRGLGSGADYYTIKYDPAGTVLWEKRYNSFGTEADSARIVIVDGNGNVYVSGASHHPGTLNDVLTLKYDAAGVQQWAKRYDGPGSEQDRAYDMALDSQGNIYIVGSSWVGSSNEDISLLRYRPDGSLAWATTYDGPAGQYDAGFAVGVDAADNVFVTGRADMPPFPFLDEMITLRYDTSGTLLWDRTYTGPVAGDDAAAYDLHIAGDGTIWVAGLSDSVIIDATALNYDADGNEVQRRRLYFTEYTEEIAYAMTVDADGDIYLTGTTKAPASTADFVTVRFRSCACPFQCDIDEDGFLTAVDLGRMIDIIYFGFPNIHDQGCSTFRFDFDCSGECDAIDLNALIDHLFFSGPGPCTPCTP